jgi:acylphosphatase
MKVRANIIVKGRVNGVGYREIVDEKAFPLELSGYVRELAEGSVEVVCEGEQEVIQAFIKRISLVKYPVRVTGMEVRYSDASGEFVDFRILREGGPISELGERLESALRCVRDVQAELASLQDGRELLSRLLVVQHKALERLDRAVRLQNAMLEGHLRMVKKQDRGVRDVHASLRIATGMLHKQDAIISAVRNLDRHCEERSARANRRLDRIASAQSAIANASGAVRRKTRKRQPRMKEAAAANAPSPAAIEEGMAAPAPSGAAVTEGGIAG